MAMLSKARLSQHKGKILVIWFVLIFALFATLNFLFFINLTGERKIPASLESSINSPITLASINEDSHREWLRILTTATVVYSKRLPGGGYSSKFKIYLLDSATSNVYLAIGKLVEPDPRSSQGDIISILGQEQIESDERMRFVIDLKRAHRRLQGGNELVAYHIDRAMEFNQKPAHAGRYISSRILYSDWPSPKNSGEFSDFLSAVSDKLYELVHPEATIKVVLSPWIIGLEETVPSAKVYLDLSQQTQDNPDVSLLKRISDIILFDFIVDDHDRLNEKNWMTFNGNHLQWDNGLSFDHSLISNYTCTSILCGLRRWHKLKPEGEKAECQPICRFRKETWEKVKQLDSQRSKGVSLGVLVNQSISQDIFYPVVNSFIYTLEDESQYFWFHPNLFWNRIDWRVSKLVSHINDCIANFGEDTVFI